MRRLAALPQKARQAIAPAIKEGADEIVAMQKRLPSLSPPHLAGFSISSLAC